MFPPVRSWLPGYQRSDVGRDAVGGLTVWALVVPESMAYASIAGVPVQFGLYSVPLAVLGYFLFASSRRLFVGPSATVAALTASAVAPLAAAGTDSYIALVGALALMVGVMYIVLGLLRMGFIARLFARPVLDGFMVGLGLFIAVGQLNKLFGVEKADGNTVQQFIGVFQERAEWDPATMAVAAVALLILFGGERLMPKVPGALVAVVFGLVVVPLLDLEAKGVEVVGDVPTGISLVPWSSVTLDDMVALVPGALAIVVVGFAQSIAIAKSYALADRTTVDADAELVAYGAASLGAGALQGFAPTGSLSKTAAAQGAGARTPVAYLIAGALTLLTVLFLAGVFATLPEAVLGSVVIHAVWGSMRPTKLTALRAARVPDFWLALVALLGVIFVGILAGVVLGVALSLILLLKRMAGPHTALLGVDSSGSRYADLAENTDVHPVPGVLILRVDGPMVFANVDAIFERLSAELAGGEYTRIVLDLESVYEVDTTAVADLRRFVEDQSTQGVEVVLARVHGPVRDYLTRAHGEQLLAEGTCFPTVRAAVDRSAPSR
ncbi:MAG TPA: SulP family inorganic anion transporter [Dermatophilaceae bacterium]|nr:SulP family inorganic anion transporter [Dermatophilaceae bacterium]